MKLKIKDLNVNINNKNILKNINLELNKGDVALILGPNGHGKSTLLKTIMNHYLTNIISGKIFFNDNDITNLETDKIAQMGIYYAFQHPIAIPGLKTIELLRTISSKSNNKINAIDLYKKINDKLKKLDIEYTLLNRNINENFSGGEQKKSELLQLELLDSELLLIDEIDSGVDIDSLNLINNAILNHISNKKTILYISHNPKQYETIKPNKVFIIVNGSIVKTGGFEICEKVSNEGYKWLESELNIKIHDHNESDDFIKFSTDGFYCHGK